MNITLKTKEKMVHSHWHLAAYNTNITKKYTYSNQEDTHSLINDIIPINKQQQYDYAISKLKTLKSIIKSNKNDLEYRQIIIAKHKIEWHRKISLAVACILLFFIGAPLGALVRKGGFGLPVLISVFFFVFYHVLFLSSSPSPNS